MAISINNETVKFKGKVNEQSDFEAIKLIESDKIIIDLQDLELFNSLGFQKLIKLLEELKDKKIEYHNCTLFFANQIDMLIDLLGDNITVKSFYIDFYCENCDYKVSKHLSTKELIDANKKDHYLNKVCDGCHEQHNYFPESELEFLFLDDMT